MRILMISESSPNSILILKNIHFRRESGSTTGTSKRNPLAFPVKKDTFKQSTDNSLVSMQQSDIKRIFRRGESDSIWQVGFVRRIFRSSHQTLSTKAQTDMKLEMPI